MEDSKRFNSQSIPNGSHGETGDDRISSGSFEVCKNNSAFTKPHPLTSNLMARLARHISDKRLLRIVRGFLNAGLMQNGVVLRRTEGTPQGGPLSPLLANLLLDDLDKELERRGHRFCRYADDCNIYVQSLKAGQRIMASISRFLET